MTMKYDAFYIKAKSWETIYNYFVLIAQDEINNYAIEVYCDYNFTPNTRYTFCGRTLIDDEEVALSLPNSKELLEFIIPYVGKMCVGNKNNIKLITATPIKKEMYDFLTAPQNTIVQG